MKTFLLTIILALTINSCALIQYQYSPAQIEYIKTVKLADTSKVFSLDEENMLWSRAHRFFVEIMNWKIKFQTNIMLVVQSEFEPYEVVIFKEYEKTGLRLSYSIRYNQSFVLPPTGLEFKRRAFYHYLNTGFADRNVRSTTDEGMNNPDGLPKK